MKRDLDLIRAILLAIELDPARYSNPTMPGATESELRGHLELLIDAGLVVASAAAFATAAWRIDSYRLTWAGHEFLESAREQKRWVAAKKTIELAGGASFQVLTAVLAKLAAQAVGIHTP